MRRLLPLLLMLPALALADAERAFRELWEEDWEFRLREFPRLASSVGDDRFADQLGSFTEESFERRHRYRQQVAKRLAEIDRSALSPASRINYDLFKRQIDDALADFDTNAHLIPLNSDWGFHIALARLGDGGARSTVEDFENYLARLRQVARVMAENMALMRRGMALGMVQPRVVLEGRDVSIRTHVVDDPRESVFFAPFRQMPDHLPAEDRQRIADAAVAIIADDVVPAYAAFLEFFNGPYLEAARDELGAETLPGGKRFYKAQIQRYTTLDLSPDEIHEIGVAEVKRIRGEMQAIIDELEFEGTFDEFLTFLREDPQFYAQSARELLAEAAYYAKKIDGRLPAFFGRLPRQPYGIEPVPSDLAPFFTAGRYVPAGARSRRGGLYWVNTYDLPTRTLYTLPALTLHEATPGHHLQGALARELGDLPPYRRHDYISAFGEGWALYAEWLGIEADIYETPYEHFGRLTYEMWRACRLVVDTGLHAKGWTRERAVDFMTANTALSIHEINTEVDRYISWPAQALSYKLGEIKIRELRKRAEAALGTDFDVRDFHDVVLGQGSVPLDVLEQIIDAWIAAQG
ncbi:MAG: DUF885 family protein [Pseudomonadota bacterium]